MVDLMRGHGFAGITKGEARDLVTTAVGSDPWATIEQLRQIGDALAEAEATLTRMDGETKSVKARLQSEIASAHPKESFAEAKLERLALADPRYSQHIAGLAAAVEQKEKLKNAYWTTHASLSWDEHAVRHLSALSRLEK